MNFFILGLLIFNLNLSPFLSINPLSKPSEPPIEYKTLTNQTIYDYNSEVGQTDSSPFKSPSQLRVRNGIVANNCLPFKTKVKILNRYYEVQDRLNARYNCNVWDIWMSSKEEAIQWGRRNLTVKIYEET